MWIINSVTIWPILICYAKYILKKNEIEDPRKTKEEKESVKKKVNTLEKILYALCIIVSVLQSICMLFLIDIDSLDIFIKIIVTIVIALAVISVINRICKKKQVSNILAIIVITPAILGFLITPFISFYYIVQKKSSCQNSVQNELIDKRAFNAKFIQYEGNKTGAQVKTLLQEIISNNSNPNNESRLISIEFLDKDGKPWTGISFDKTSIIGSSNIKTNQIYNVKFEYADEVNSSEEGIIKQCIISQVDNK